MDQLRKKAIKLGASDLVESTRKNKKYTVVYEGKEIHFGDSRYQDWRSHKDPIRRANYLKRARGIRDKDGKLTYKDPTKANFWSINLLW